MKTARRRVLRALAALGLVAVNAYEQRARAATAKLRIVVVGGGYGGATAARYARLWGGDAVDVTLVERDSAFVSCPLSNLVLGGSRSLEEISVSYRALGQRGV